MSPLADCALSQCKINGFSAQLALFSMDLRLDPLTFLIRKIALPASLGMLFSVLLSIVDTFYAGLLSATALAALSLAGPVFFLVFTLGIGVGQATNALVGNQLGADRPAHAQQLAFQSMAFAALVSVLAALMAFWQLPNLFTLMGGEAPYLAPASRYMTVLLIGTPLFSLSMVINSVLNTRGDTRSYRNAQLVGLLANIVLDPLFMFTFGMGVTGVAVATIIIQLGVVIFMFGKAVRLDFMRLPQLPDFIPNATNFIELAKQSIPTTLSMLLVAAGSFIIVAYVSKFGEPAMAAYGIALRIEQLMLLPVIGINIAALSLTGVNYGAMLLGRVRATFNIGVTYAIVLTVVGAIPLVLFGDQLMRIFTNDAKVIAIGVDYLRIEALILPAYAITFIANAVLQGLKKPIYTLYSNVVRQVIGQLVLFYLVIEVFKLGINGVWFSVLAINWIMAAVNWWLYSVRIRHIEAHANKQSDGEEALGKFE